MVRNNEEQSIVNGLHLKVLGLLLSSLPSAVAFAYIEPSTLKKYKWVYLKKYKWVYYVCVSA